MHHTNGNGLGRLAFGAVPLAELGQQSAGEGHALVGRFWIVVVVAQESERALQGEVDRKALRSDGKGATSSRTCC